MTRRKGIILAGGTGSRLYPATLAINKQLLPVYDKPMIYYPLSTLMLAGLKDILIISTPADIPSFQNLLGDGSKFGIKLSYQVQPSPDGLPQAFILAESFLDGDPSVLILGDNIFYGHELQGLIAQANMQTQGACVFAYHVTDPKRYGVAEFDVNGKVVSIEEKPKIPKSNFAITGLYFYDHTVVEKAKSLKPSLRGELEITDLNRLYLEMNELSVQLMGRGFAWLDTGTHESLLDASMFFAAIEKRQGLKIACLEEIAYRQGWITATDLKAAALSMKKNTYGQYLMRIVSD